jgi:hypothetical protein
MSKSNALTKLEGPFVAIARTRAKEWDLQVVDGGTKISTDGKRIFIPFRLGEVQTIPVQVLHGYLDHEVGHVIEERRHKTAGRETPMAIMGRLGNANLRMMMNVFEDIRMERRQGDEYPGVADNLNAAADYSVQKMLAARPKDFWANIGGALICNASGKTLAWMEPAFTPYLEAIQPEMDESCDRDRLVWGQDSERLARSVIDKLKEVAKEESKPTPPPPSEPGKDEAESGKRDEDDEDEDDAPSSSDDSEDSEDEGDDSDSGSEDSAEDGEDEEDSDGAGDESDGDGSEGDDSEDEGDDSEGGSEGDDSEDEGDGEGANDEESGGDSSGEETDSDASPEDGGRDGDKPSEDAGEGEPKPTDAERMDLARRASETTKTEHVMDVVGEEIEDACKRVDDGKYTAPVDKSKDVWRKASTVPTNPRDKTTYQDLATIASSVTGALRNKLRVVLQARAECRRIADQVRGELDSSALHTLRVGGKRIFTTEVKGEKLDVSVSILIDQSGSMGSSTAPGSRSAMARLAAVALGQALDAVGIPFEMVGFTNAHVHGYGIVLPSANRRDYRAPFVFDVFKAFGESFRDTKDRLTSITGYADNADGEAVWECAKRLAVRSSERRVLIVLSDGVPQCDGIHPVRGANYLREVVKRITSSGIEVIGVGIMHDQVKDFYNEKTGAKWVNVETLPDLPVVVVKALSESLLARRAKS